MKKTLILVFAAILAFSACKKETVPDEFALSKTEFAAEADGTSFNVAVTANCAWNVTNTTDWITVEPMSGSGDGTIVIKVAANEGDDRNASFSVKGGSVEPVTVSVSQTGAPSNLAFGTPVLVGKFQVGQSGTASVEIPYTGSNGKEAVDFKVDIESTYANEANKGIESTSFNCSSFTKGDGKVVIPVSGTPEKLGAVTIKVTAGSEALKDELSARVTEKLPYTTYVAWNPWAAGYTRQDFCFMAGGPYDKSWSTMGKEADKVASTNASDHIVLPTDYSNEEFKDAYLTAVAANAITAGGVYTVPKTTASLAGYTFNPGVQIQGLAKDDYILVAVPVKSAAKGAKVTVLASMGGAAAAAGYFLLEFSMDKTNWIEFPDAKSITVGDTEYKYHYNDVNSTDKTIRYTYSKDVAVDAGVASYTAELPVAVSNATAYLRLLAVGLNGSSAVMTKTGWSDLKYLEISIQ